jgi:hypothetical protein
MPPGLLPRWYRCKSPQHTLLPFLVWGVSRN